MSLDLPLRLQRAVTSSYRVAGEIGRGGMSVVFRAHDLRADRDVAIKVLLPAVAQALGTQRFLREVALAGTLIHPNIVPVVATGEADGLPYYVMPLIPGDSLRARLGPGKSLSIGEVLALSAQVAAALDHAHVRGVVHRDIKPENLLVAEEHVFVTDFGVGKALNVAGGSSLTDTGFIVGTPEYMSPEQAAGDPELDARSDLYSLGAVMYEMIAGAAPFAGRTAQQVIAMRFVHAPRSVHEFRDGVPDSLATAVHRLLALHPGERFPDARGLIDALQDIHGPSA